MECKTTGSPVNSSNLVNRRQPDDSVTKSKTSGEIVSLPFTGNDNDDCFIIDALRKVNENGNAQEKNQAFSALLKSCQNDTLPVWTRDLAKIFLSDFLRKMLPPDDATVPLMDKDQLLEDSLKKLLFSEVEKVAVSTRDKNSDDVNPIKAGMNNPALATDDQDIKVSIEKVQQIYSYLRHKVDDQFLCDLSENLMPILNDELAADLNQKVEKINKDITIKNGVSSFIEKALSSIIEKHLSTIIETELSKAIEIQLFLITKSMSSATSEYQISTFIDNRLLAIKNPKSVRTNILIKEIEKELSILFNNQLGKLSKMPQKQFSTRVENELSTKIKNEFSLIIKNKRGELLTILENKLTEIIENKVSKNLAFFAGASKQLHSTTILPSNWLSLKPLDVIQNRMKIITEYGAKISSTGHLTHFQHKIEEQIHILLQQVQEYKNQRNTEAAEQLLYQLIDIVKELGLANNPPHITKFCSSSLQLLLESHAIDDTYKNEIKVWKAISDGEGRANDKKALDRLIIMGNRAKRPISAHQLGMIYLPADLTKANVETAEGIQKARYFFQKDAAKKHAPSIEKLRVLTDAVKSQIVLAEQYMDKHPSRTISGVPSRELDKMLSLYKWAGIAGHTEANFRYLELLSSIEDDVAKKLKYDKPAAQFELGNLYFHGSETSLPEQDILKAKTLFESAAKSGHKEALNGAESALKRLKLDREAAKVSTAERLQQIGQTPKFNYLTEKSFQEKMNEFVQKEKGVVGDNLFNFNNDYTDDTL